MTDISSADKKDDNVNTRTLFIALPLIAASLQEFIQFIWWMQNCSERMSTRRSGQMTWATRLLNGWYELKLQNTNDMQKN